MTAMLHRSFAVIAAARDTIDQSNDRTLNDHNKRIERYSELPDPLEINDAKSRTRVCAVRNGIANLIHVIKPPSTDPALDARSVVEIPDIDPDSSEIRAEIVRARISTREPTIGGERTLHDQPEVAPYRVADSPRPQCEQRSHCRLETGDEHQHATVNQLPP